MISEMIEYGKWLTNNGIEPFGKNVVVDDDWILPIYFNGNDFTIGDFSQKKNFNFNKYHNKSIFSEDFFYEDNQALVIPSKSHLFGISPFFIKLDHNFMKKDSLDEGNISKFKRKIERSINDNSNDKGFIKILKLIYDDFEDFLNIDSLSSEGKSVLKDFFKNYSLTDVKNIIVNYYNFLYSNSDNIIGLVNNLKKSGEYIKKENPKFYLACMFSNEIDLLNDILFLYTKFYKKRKETINNYEDGICSFCGNKKVIYSQLGSYSITPKYSFNNIADVENSKLKICKDCNAYLRTAEQILKSTKVNNIFLIPKNKSSSSSSSYKYFSKIHNSELNFKGLNKLLKDLSYDFNFDLVVYTTKKDIMVINRYIENYRAFLGDFNEKYIKLYDSNSLNYLFKEKGFDDKKWNDIKNIFDIGSILMRFFININDSTISNLNISNLFEIYTKEFSKIGSDFNKSTMVIFSKYMHNIFNFVYELNLTALNINMLNEIVVNVLFLFQKNSYSSDYSLNIKDKLNDYYMIRKEFLGDNMIEEENIDKIKSIFKEYSEINDELGDDIYKIIDENPAIKYYLLGQFIRLIHNSKNYNNKNSNIFTNFIENANRHNIKNLFATEILQKNIFYINKSKKAKFIFNLIENNLNSLFNDDFSYEDYIILLFTGFYTTNILSSNFKEGGN